MLKKFLFESQSCLSEHERENLMNLREVVHRQPQIRLYPICPLIRQFLAPDTTNVHRAE